MKSLTPLQVLLMTIICTCSGALATACEQSMAQAPDKGKTEKEDEVRPMVWGPLKFSGKQCDVFVCIHPKKLEHRKACSRRWTSQAIANLSDAEMEAVVEKAPEGLDLKNEEQPLRVVFYNWILKVCNEKVPQRSKIKTGDWCKCALEADRQAAALLFPGCGITLVKNPKQCVNAEKIE